MTSYHQVEDSLRLLCSTYQSTSTAFQSILETLLECTPRTTEPAFYSIVIQQSDGVIYVQPEVGSKYQTVGDDTGGLDMLTPYSYNRLIADVLDFCYKKNASLLERRYLLKVIEGLIVSPDYLLTYRIKDDILGS